MILGFTDLIIDPSIGKEERDQFAFTLKRNGERLSVLINDILDLSKVESGFLKVENISFSLRGVVREIISELDSKAHEKGLQLITLIQPHVTDRVTSDPTRLKQILLNLVGNAIKFTKKGQIELKIEETENILHIEIEDTGIGIKKEEQEKLFRPFSQADESMTRKYGGTGLGLALSKRLAELLGGNLILKRSEPNHGSIFELTIKNHLGQEQRSQRWEVGPQLSSVRGVSSSNETLSGMKILLTEDSPENQLFISRILSKKGAEVDIANNGSEGVERALRCNYDVVLMDLQMPVLDGYSATQRLRDQGYRKAIIALTAHVMNDIREQCMNVGFTDHLPKPINQKQLVDTIIKHVRLEH